MDALNPDHRHIIRLEAVAVIALHTALVLTLGIPPLTYAVMYAGFGFSCRARGPSGTRTARAGAAPGTAGAGCRSDARSS